MTQDRIAVVSSSISRLAGGLFQSVRELSLSLARSNNLEIVPFSVDDRYSASDIPDWNPLVPRMARSCGPAKLAFGPSLSSKLREFNPDLIHIHGIWQFPNLAVDRHHLRFKTPVILSPRGMLDEWAMRNSTIVKRFALFLFQRNQLLSNVACLHALCEAEANSIRKFGCKAPIAILPNGTNRYDSMVTPPRSGKVNRPYMLSLGRLHPKKGILELIRAWARSSQRGEAKMQLVIAGEGESDFREKVLQLIRSLEVPMSASITDWTNEANIILTGDVRGELKKSLLYHSTGFVLPSFSEGLPLAVLEAWSYGKPVLMTRACNIPEGFASGASMEIPVHSSLQSGIEQSLIDFSCMSEAQRRTMGLQGLQLIDTKFNWKNISDQMAAVYQWLLGKGERPNCVLVD